MQETQAPAAAAARAAESRKATTTTAAAAAKRIHGPAGKAATKFGDPPIQGTLTAQHVSEPEVGGQALKETAAELFGRTIAAVLAAGVGAGRFFVLKIFSGLGLLTAGLR